MAIRHTIARLIALLSLLSCKDLDRNSSAGHRAEGAPPIASAESTPAAAGPIQVPPGERGAISFQEGFAPIVQRLSSAVVNISSIRVVQAPSPGRSQTFSNPLFREFFGEDPFPFQAPRERREQSLGSGVLVSEDGYVLTNNHVVEDASQVRVSLLDKREFQAKIIGTDPPTDVAVLKIDGTKLPFVPFGDSAKVRVGEFALAIGNPFGLGQTVTLGIISAIGRGNIGIVDYEDFIQTDAAINPGNSGGALISSDGELIGINTAILSRGAQGNQGIGFAVPSQLARAVMDQILRVGHVVRGWMGVAIQDVTPAMREALALKEAKGVLVSEVTPGSPAERAGIERGDVIVEADGQPVTDSRSFRMHIAQAKPESKVRIGLLRGESKREVTVALATLPDKERRPAAAGGDRERSERLGLASAPLSQELRQKLNLPPTV